MSRRVVIGSTALDLMQSMEKGLDTIPELIEDTGRAASNVYGAMNRLLQQGLIRRTAQQRGCPDGNGTLPATYELTSLGRDEYWVRVRAGREPGVPIPADQHDIRLVREEPKPLRGRTQRCPDCKAIVLYRYHVNALNDPALFTETYVCGAVRAWGLVADAAHILRPCPTREGGTDPQTSPDAAPAEGSG